MAIIIHQFLHLIFFNSLSVALAIINRTQGRKLGDKGKKITVRQLYCSSILVLLGNSVPWLSEVPAITVVIVMVRRTYVPDLSGDDTDFKYSDSVQHNSEKSSDIQQCMNDENIIQSVRS